MSTVWDWPSWRMKLTSFDAMARELTVGAVQGEVERDQGGAGDCDRHRVVVKQRHAKQRGGEEQELDRNASHRRTGVGAARRQRQRRSEGRGFRHLAINPRAIIIV